MKTKDDPNAIRLIAAQCIHRLWVLGDETQLKLLLMQVTESIRRKHTNEDDE